VTKTTRAGAILPVSFSQSFAGARSGIVRWYDTTLTEADR
jgi:hypothetical protein